MAQAVFFSAQVYTMALIIKCSQESSRSFSLFMCSLLSNPQFMTDLLSLFPTVGEYDFNIQTCQIFQKCLLFKNRSTEVYFIGEDPTDIMCLDLS